MTRTGEPLDMKEHMPGPEAAARPALLLALAAVASLPFMQAFSVNVGFPLKIYEIAIILWSAVAIITLQMPVFNKRFFLTGLLFFLYAAAALLINVQILGKEGSYSYLARFTPILDGLLKSGYVLLCVLGFNLFAYAAALDPARAVRAWYWGAGASAAIQILLFLLSAAGLPLPPLPGMVLEPPPNLQFIDFMGMFLYRAGTFLEGNYAGPFFVLSFLIALADRRNVLAGFFLLAAATTFSTSAFAGLAGAFVYLLLTKKKQPSVYILAAAITAAMFFSWSFFEAIIIEKLSGAKSTDSLVDRMNTFLSAAQMFAGNIVLGVGLGQYGFHAFDYTDWVQRSLGPWFMDTRTKTIANNVYAELASELGLLGLVFFYMFVSPIVRMALKISEPAIKAGFVAIAIFWIAAPTFTIMYYWAFAGLACGIAYYRGEGKPSAA